MFDLELGQRDRAEVRLDVSPYQDLVRRPGGWLPTASLRASVRVVPWPDVLFHPVVEPGGDGERFARKGQPVLLSLESGG
jgi:hypothetical protein